MCCFFLSEHSHSMIFNCRQDQIFGITTSAILLDRVFNNSHSVFVAHENEHWFASDFGLLSAISQNLSASKYQG